MKDSAKKVRATITPTTLRRIFGPSIEKITLMPVPGSVASGLAGDDIAVGHTIETLSTAAEKELRFYKNVMNPKIRSFIETVNSIENNAFSGEPMLSVVSPSELYNEFDTRGDTSNIVIRKFENETITLLPSFRVNDIEISASKNNGLIDIAFKVIHKATKKEINIVWNDYFLKGTDDYLNAVNYPTLTNTTFERIELALAMATVMQATDNISVLTTTTRGVAFVTFADIMRNIALKSLDEIFSRYTAGIETGEVIMAKGESHIVINDKTFGEYINEGGDIDVIFGAFVQDLSHVTKEGLKANHVDLRNAWNEYMASTIAKRTSLAATALRGTYVRIGTRIFSERIGSEMKTILDTMSDTEVLDVQSTCKRLALETEYKNTNGKYFLDRVAFYINKGVTIEKAVGITYVDMLCSFIAKQVKSI